MSDIKLKPCPFCGGEATILATHLSPHTDAPMDFAVQCRLCCASTIRYRAKKQYAIDDWNRRVESSEDK